MSNVRIIPCLLLQNKKLVKTISFKQPKYIGDPLNAIKIYNNLFVDEIILLDISQAESHSPIDFAYLKALASECFIPICYGGGVSSLDTAKRLFSIGIEKVSVNTAAAENLQFIKTLSTYFGSQSIVAAIDCKKSLWSGYKVIVHNKKRLTCTLLEYAQLLEEQGAGELLINSIDRDGLMTGYDIELLKNIAEKVTIPIIASGGAGSLYHMKEVLTQTGINAFAAGSLFVYSGRLNAVLINYPARKKIKEVFC